MGQQRYDNDNNNDGNLGGDHVGQRTKAEHLATVYRQVDCLDLHYLCNSNSSLKSCKKSWVGSEILKSLRRFNIKFVGEFYGATEVNTSNHIFFQLCCSWLFLSRVTRTC